MSNRVDDGKHFSQSSIDPQTTRFRPLWFKKHVFRYPELYLWIIGTMFHRGDHMVHQVTLNKLARV
jgi:hypothetical protein